MQQGGETRNQGKKLYTSSLSLTSRCKVTKKVYIQKIYKLFILYIYIQSCESYVSCIFVRTIPIFYEVPGFPRN